MQRLRELKADIRKELAAVWRREARGRRPLPPGGPGAAGQRARCRRPGRGLGSRPAPALAGNGQSNPSGRTTCSHRGVPPASSAAAGIAENWRKQAEHFAKEQRERSAFNRDAFPHLRRLPHRHPCRLAGGRTRLARRSLVRRRFAHPSRRRCLAESGPAGRLLHAHAFRQAQRHAPVADLARQSRQENQFRGDGPAPQRCRGWSRTTASSPTPTGNAWATTGLTG